MEPPTHRRPAMRSPAPSPTPADGLRTSSKQSQRPSSSGSDTSASSNLAGLSIAKRSPYSHNLPTFTSQANHSNTSVGSQTRPAAEYLAHDGAVRRHSPLAPPAHLQKHRPRQHSQGFFEPSMPSASLASQSALNEHNMPLTASQIAAQAAMQHLAEASHQRKRSSNVPDPLPQDSRRASRSSPPPTHQPPQAMTEQQYRNGLIGTSAAATAANAAFPRNQSVSGTSGSEEKESRKGLKRFRPKNIGISRDKDKEAKERPMPSPNKIIPSGLSKVVNASTASLVETLSSHNSSLYNLQNPSQSTIIPVQEKEKGHRHGLRQKLKLKDKDEMFALPLSSVNSNSRPTDMNNPQSIYSFAPPSPGPSSTFAKTVSGLDLRHGGRALREKKKEDKANASANANAPESAASRSESEISEWPSLQASGTSHNSQSTTTFTPYAPDYSSHLAGFGLHNMTPDDAWDYLKAKLLVVFEGENVRIPVEDLNRLVSVHIQRCVQKRDPSIIIGDLEDLLHTGFSSLNHTLKSVPEEKVVPHLVSMWIDVFGRILPFMQAVFLPLDQEFKGRGSTLTSPRMAAEFWGSLPSAETGSQLSSSLPGSDDMHTTVSAGEELEVRRTLLIVFRDLLVLPRFDILKATFSRLSLESINATLAHLETTGRDRGNSGGSDRPNTAQSLDPNYASYGSQTSTLLGTASSGARSRATSNLSNTSNPAQEVAFQSFSSPPAARPGDNSSAQVTETVGRMLQCLSVICSVQSGDEAQTGMEELNRQLKLNWLGRGRTGRNRKGFVGSRVRPMRSVGSTIRGQEREGSPTPTPTRQGTVSRQGDDSRR